MSGKQFDNGEKERLGEKLDAMNKRLGRETKQQNLQGDAEAGKPGLGKGMQMSSEFVAAILVGLAIGFGIDWLIGTKPWMMIIFLMLGFVAGVLNVLRSAGQMSGPYELKGSDKKGPDNTK
ncbi:MAG: AtpZ/AtpI family protein [Pseudomonadota bacterium]